MPTSAYHITPEELFDALCDLAAALPADSEAIVPTAVNRELHEQLVQTCHEGIRDSQQAFGNLFAQVDYLCRTKHVAVPDRIAIQTLRRHSNRNEPLTAGDLRYDLRALALFISAVFGVSVPSRVVDVIPPTNRPHERAEAIDYRYLRCIVRSWDKQIINAVDERTDTPIRIDYTAEHLAYIGNIIHEGTQINLLDCTNIDGLLVPDLIVVEPDFMVDISSIAASFESFGHHPLNYTVRRMAPSTISQAILLGHLAGTVLDDTIHQRTDLNDSIRKFFRQKALDVCLCPGFDAETFKADAIRQAHNIRDAVGVLYPQPPTNAILEPSFICESLGLQGRVDLMNTDFSLLVEQKSGKNFNIERRLPGPHGSLMLEPHYVQLLLYYGILKHNFHLSNFDTVNLRLLYSRFPAKDGLVVVNFLRSLFREAIQLRNLIVTWDLHIARQGFESIFPLLSAETLNINHQNDRFYNEYQLPRINATVLPLHALNPLERAYFCRMMTFVYREQRVSRLGNETDAAGPSGAPWNVPLEEKALRGDILTGLRISHATRSKQENGLDLLTLSRPSPLPDIRVNGDSTSVPPPTSEPNFRRGDPVYLYSHKSDEIPDMRKALLLKATIKDVSRDDVTVALYDGLSDITVIGDGPFAIEHAPMDNTTSAIRSIHAFATSDPQLRQLILGQREPRRDLSKAGKQYAPAFDPIITAARQALDYYLVIGPPGTGKTSQAMQYLVRDNLAEGNILLTAYTHRAVDEICEMLSTAQLPFIRIGNENNCDPRFHSHLMANVAGDKPRLSELKQKLRDTPIVVGTTLTLLALPSLFDVKRFSLAIVDEASQILEPYLLGILARVPKFILIGDHKQLPAVVQQSPEESTVSEPALRQIQLFDCRNSLFERLLRIERKAGRDTFIGVLNHQGRMHPDIAVFPSCTFYARERLQPVPLPHQLEPTTSPRMVFIPAVPTVSDTLTEETVHLPTGGSRSSDIEARIVANELLRIYQHYGPDFSPQKTVGVIVPYRNQIALIRQHIERLIDTPQPTELSAQDGTASLPHPLLSVTIDTVERYQRDIIIYSFTVSRPTQLEFLTATTFKDDDGTLVDRKLNVALTRARRKLIMTGNPEVLRRIPLFRQLIDSAAQVDNCDDKNLEKICRD